MGASTRSTPVSPNNIWTRNGISSMSRSEPDTELRTGQQMIAAMRPAVEAMGGQVFAPEFRQAFDIPVIWEGDMIAVVRLPTLHGALDRLIASVEQQLGARLPLLSREDKQRAVRLLDEGGAFTLRRAVEDVADAMGVSRITVYNYLNAIHR